MISSKLVHLDVPQDSGNADDIAQERAMNFSTGDVTALLLKNGAMGTQTELARDSSQINAQLSIDSAIATTLATPFVPPGGANMSSFASNPIFSRSNSPPSSQPSSPQTSPPGSPRTGRVPQRHRSSRMSVDAVMTQVKERHLQYNAHKPKIEPFIDTSVKVQKLWKPMQRAAVLLNFLPIEALLINPFQSPLQKEWANVTRAVNACILQLSTLDGMIANGVRSYSDRTLMRFWLYVIEDMVRDLSALAAMLEKISEQVVEESGKLVDRFEECARDAMTADTRSTIFLGIRNGFRNYWDAALSDGTHWDR